MHVTPKAVPFAPHDKCGLRMSFKTQKSVHDVHSCAFETLSPLDVVGFVETSFYFYQRSHLFAALTSFDEKRGDRRIGPDTVETHLDSEHVRILYRFPDKIRNYAVWHIRMMQQHILSSDDVEFRLAGLEYLGFYRDKRLVLEIRAIQVTYLESVCDLQRAVDRIHVIAFDLERFHEVCNHFRGHRTRNLQAHDVAEATLL